MPASAPPGSVALRVRKIVPPLGAPGSLAPSTAISMFCAVVPTLVSVSTDTASSVSFCAGADGPAAETVMAGTPTATNGPWLPALVGTARRSTCAGAAGSSTSRLESLLAAGAVSSHSHGGAVLGTELQPSMLTPSLSRLATSRSATAGEEVVRLVRLDELSRAERPERVAGGAQEDDGVLVGGHAEGIGEAEERGDARGVVPRALRGERRDVPVGEDHDGAARAAPGDCPRRSAAPRLRR